MQMPRGPLRDPWSREEKHSVGCDSRRPWHDITWVDIGRGPGGGKGLVLAISGPRVTPDRSGLVTPPVMDRQTESVTWPDTAPLTGAASVRSISAHYFPAGRKTPSSQARLSRGSSLHHVLPCVTDGEFALLLTPTKPSFPALSAPSTTSSAFQLPRERLPRSFRCQ
jgi:hypothetical protein